MKIQLFLVNVAILSKIAWYNTDSDLPSLFLPVLNNQVGEGAGGDDHTPQQGEAQAHNA